VTAVAKAVPSAVAPSASNTVQILTDPQLGPYQPMTGSAVIPVVPQAGAPDDVSPQPGFGGAYGEGGQFNAGSQGAPSVPGMGGQLFTNGPIDAHYRDETETRNPYAKVNNPPTRGMFTRVQEFLNHIAQSPQNVDPNGFRARPAQQRTSVMLNTMPSHGGGYAPETYTPRQMPQRGNTAKYLPATGTQGYGVTQPNGGTGSAKGVLNSDTYGAGQTAGGIGGSQYTPQPGPPATYSTASQDIANYSGMPTWG
jgi:hypothetical protein